jgi:XapX domain-containing protein
MRARVRPPENTDGSSAIPVRNKLQRGRLPIATIESPYRARLPIWSAVRGQSPEGRGMLPPGAMRQSLISLILGLAVGVVYGLLRVRSPAPPLVALVGLLGMLAGERAASIVRARIEPSAPQAAAAKSPPLEQGK